MAKTVTLTIRGMHCNGCAMGTKAALMKLPQVVSAAVSFAEKSAVVVCEDAAYDEGALREAVRAAGFEVTGVR